jgi:serine/threonine protein phosphatase PrpC
MIHSFGLSDAGPVRPNNEDCFLTDDELSLFVVADGMGGHAAGEVASRVAVEAIEHFIRDSQGADDLSWPCGLDSDLSFTGNRLKSAIHVANSRVLHVAEGHDGYAGMGTTVVCALMSGPSVSIGHVGDSRLYLLSNGLLSAQTRDDTWAATVLAGAEGDLMHLTDHPMRNVLTNVLGAREQAEIHVSERTLADGEMLLLCTDGVHTVVDDDALHDLLTKDAPVEVIARSVVAAALDRGSRDNVTALVVRYSSPMTGAA